MLHHPVPESHLKNIGDITVSFAMLESQLQSLIGSLLNERQRIGQIITAELSFKALKALLVSLYIERHGNDDSDFGQLKRLILRCGKIEEKRNQITHSVWGAGSDVNHITRIKTTAKENHGIKFQFEDVSSQSLANIAIEIKILAHDLFAFYMHLLESGKAINNSQQQSLP